MFFSPQPQSSSDHPPPPPPEKQISLPLWNDEKEEKQSYYSEEPSKNEIETRTRTTTGQDDSNNNTATLFSCAINLSNTIVGAGMLGLPGAFGGTGYLGGTILLFTGFYFSTQGLMLLSRSAVKVGVYPSSFYTVAHAAVPQYTMLIDLAVALKCFGVATGYLITVGDCMVEAFDLLLQNNDYSSSPKKSLLHSILLSRRTWVTFALLAVLPVSFFQQFHKLKHASATALIFVFFLTAGIVAYAHDLLGDPCEGIPTEECVGKVEAVTDVPTTFSKLPIFIFAFTCQQNIFPVVNEIQNRTISRLDATVWYATGFALFIFYIVAMEGYLTYGSLVKGDILLNYPENVKVTIMRICIAFMLTLHYPLQLDPSRRCILSLMKEAKRRILGVSLSSSLAKQDDDNVEDHTTELLKMSSADANKAYYSAIDNANDIDENINADDKTNKKGVGDETNDTFVEHEYNDDDDNDKNETNKKDSFSFYAVTYIYLGLSYSLAMIVDDLGIILALVGATGSTLVSYVLPGLIYIKIFKEIHFWRIMAMIQLCLGCCLMPIALYFVLRGASAH